MPPGLWETLDLYIAYCTELWKASNAVSLPQKDRSKAKMSALCHWTQIIGYCKWDYLFLSTNLSSPIRFQVICIDILTAHDIWPFHLNWLKCQHATTWEQFVNNYRKRLNTKFPVLCCSTLIDRLSISELTAVLVGCLRGNTVGPTS